MAWWVLRAKEEVIITYLNNANMVPQTKIIIMKKLYFLMTLVCFAACKQPDKQYSENSPEIESIKKSLQAFLSQDWVAFRSIYADSAKIAVNTSDKSKFINNDQHIEDEKATHASFTDIKLEDLEYKMVITDKGEKWVLVWFNGSAKTKAGVEVKITGHEKFLFVEGKVVFQQNYYDTLPFYLAMQPADSTSIVK
jgi:hypothetical protein